MAQDIFLTEMGITPTSVPRDDLSLQKKDEPPKKPPQKPQTPAPATTQAPKPVFAAAQDEARASRIASLDFPALLKESATCTACALCSERKQVVFGVGDPQAAWLFIGEAPGEEEDALGEPFVGQAGKLLDAMLFSMNLQRGKGVYITNAVKCHEINGRAPHHDEIAACQPYLKRQIAMISPQIIVLLGKTASFAVLGRDEPLNQLRGKKHSYHDGTREIPTLVTYHPAYLLRNLPDKARAWEDLCLAMAWMQEIEEDKGTHSFLNIK